ncbi:MAG: hypothetical protein HC897_16370 [Thermoanaerobaculia bacterium]|nr:hypothetical protein [Thermoanaerobaculia bacterium]
MATLRVQNVPDELYQALLDRALTEQRSLGAEVILLLDTALAQANRTPARILTAIRNRRGFVPAAAGAPDSTALLREDRNH